MRVVMKFGGSSVGGAAAIREAAARAIAAREAGHECVVVVSAMRGVTDLLIGAATGAAAGDIPAADAARQTLWEMHHLAAVELLPETHRSLLGEIDAELSNFANLTTAIGVLGEVTPRALDYISSLGERFSAKLVAAYLDASGVLAGAVMADRLILTDARFGNANPDLERTGERARGVLLPMLADGALPIVTGFLGTTEGGVVTTLGRGGSDYTAAILGHALDADEIWIWSDVDGVLTADPRVVPEAHPIDHLSYTEAAELAFFGARVLHPKTVRPAIEKRIPIRMLNTFNPDYGGTLISAESHNGAPVKAVTAIRALSLITVEGRGMLGVPGVAARVFTTAAERGVSVLMISQGSSEQSICFVVAQDEAARVSRALERAFENEIARGNIDRVGRDDNVVVVAVVGSEMRGTPGIAGRLFTALGQERINVLSIAQGSSEFNISLVIEHDDAHRAIRAIHDAFDLGRSAP